MSLSERQIQRCLYYCNHQTFRLLIPNYTPRDWWECDLFGVTKAGYFHEFEIKRTVADFKKDEQKQVRRWVPWEERKSGEPLYHEENKVAQLISRSINGPSRFWYVVPDGLSVNVPDWAGLQVILADRRGWARIIKPAPQLHRTKVDEQVLRHAFGVCYYRYWHERNERDSASPPPSLDMGVQAVK